MQIVKVLLLVSMAGLSACSGSGEGYDTAILQDDQAATNVAPTLYKLIEHNSGLRLEYLESDVLPNSTDIDWMYRMWSGIQGCQGTSSATATLPTIRVSSEVAPQEEGELVFANAGEDGGDYYYRVNVENEFIEILNADTAFAAGADQGKYLADAMDVYMGFQVNDNFQGTDCPAWHSGGRHNPSPGRTGIGDVNYIYELALNVGEQTLTVKSDTTDVDEFALGYIGDVWSSVVDCHGRDEVTEINEIVVVTGKSDLFAGDNWDETGGYTVNDGGQIFIDSSDLVNTRENEDWGLKLFSWINIYVDASADTLRRQYLCSYLPGPYGDPPLPISLD